jgi:hypothetical protein
MSLFNQMTVKKFFFAWQQDYQTRNEEIKAFVSIKRRVNKREQGEAFKLWMK